LSQVQVIRPSGASEIQALQQLPFQSGSNPRPTPSAYLEEIQEDINIFPIPIPPPVDFLARPRPSTDAVGNEIERPGIDFEKSCERLGGIQLADRGMRLTIPLDRKRPKF
jgi:hypothetical protein